MYAVLAPGTARRVLTAGDLGVVEQPGSPEPLRTDPPAVAARGAAQGQEPLPAAKAGSPSGQAHLSAAVGDAGPGRPEAVTGGPSSLADSQASSARVPAPVWVVSGVVLPPGGAGRGTGPNAGVPVQQAPDSL